MPGSPCAGTEEINGGNAGSYDFLFNVANGQCGDANCVSIVNPIRHRTQEQLHIHFRHYNDVGTVMKSHLEKAVVSYPGVSFAERSRKAHGGVPWQRPEVGSARFFPTLSLRPRICASIGATGANGREEACNPRDPKDRPSRRASFSRATVVNASSGLKTLGVSWVSCVALSMTLPSLSGPNRLPRENRAGFRQHPGRASSANFERASLSTSGVVVRRPLDRPPLELVRVDPPRGSQEGRLLREGLGEVSHRRLRLEQGQVLLQLPARLHRGRGGLRRRELGERGHTGLAGRLRQRLHHPDDDPLQHRAHHQRAVSSRALGTSPWRRSRARWGRGDSPALHRDFVPQLIYADTALRCEARRASHRLDLALCLRARACGDARPKAEDVLARLPLVRVRFADSGADIGRSAASAQAGFTEVIAPRDCVCRGLP